MIQHVEIYHPENGYSPFTATQDPQDPVASSLRVEDRHQPSLASPAGDDVNNDYVDCPQDCGESIMVAELSSHLDLHIAERIALKEVGNATDDDLDKPFGSDDNCEDVYERFTTNLPNSLRNRDEILLAKNFGRRKRGAGAGENGVMKGPGTKRQRAQKAKRGSSSVTASSSVCRLGVRNRPFIIHFHGLIQLTWRTSERNWVPMPTRSRCHQTSGGCWRKVQR
jgi:hypothetical protein